jgi:hypothetical protein
LCLSLEVSTYLIERWLGKYGSYSYYHTIKNWEQF